MRTLFALTTALLLTLPSLAHADPIFPIQCNRLYKNGESYNIHHVYELTIDSLGGMVTKTPEARTKTTKAELTARVDKVHADPAHNSETFTLTIGHLINGVTKRDCIRPGTVLNVTLTATKVTFLPASGNAPIPDNAKNLLIDVFPIAGSTQKSVVDAPDPKSVGDSWKINPDAAADFFKTNHILIAPFSITGDATLAKIDDGSKALHINATIHGKDFTSDLFPARATVDKSDLTLTYNIIAPLDATTPLLDITSTCDSTIHVNSVTSTILVDQKLHMMLQQTTTLIPTATANASPK